MLRMAQRLGWGSLVHKLKLARVSPVLEWFVSRLWVRDKRCGHLPRHFLEKLDVYCLPLVKASMDTSQSVGAVCHIRAQAVIWTMGVLEFTFFFFQMFSPTCVELDRPWPTQELFAKTVGQEGPGAQTSQSNTNSEQGRKRDVSLQYE